MKVVGVSALETELAIFARVPVPGQVKTRLEPLLGSDGAYAAHIELSENTLRRLARVPGCVTTLWLDDHPNAVALDWREQFGVALAIQPAGDLGQRMMAALAGALARGRAGLVVGTDCPPIDAAYVRRSVALLKYHDVAFGPAEDGGYGLVGLAPSAFAGDADRRASELFRRVRWGSRFALSDTLSNAVRAHRRIALLPAIWDVDEPEDWLRHVALQGRDRDDC
ncbi:MAG TPA: hypothetical protein DCR65_06580 [Gammaproteobacteria bacterium]|nr:hypothetical protein [Gammaproteobacteria bacterium]